MDQELKQLLEENIKINKENNDLIHKVYRIQRWAQITRYLYWFIIIAGSLGAFYFLKPYLGNVINLYTGGAGDTTSFEDIKNNISDKQQMKDLLKSLNE